MEFTIDVNTTGRYQVLGELGNHTKAIWFVFHGYAMDANSFIQEFDCILDKQTVVIAPEGLHRFYSKSTRGKVAANWMTNELRGSDINNNIDFLNSIWNKLLESELNPNVKLGILGFSQGGPTAMRWAAQLEREIQEIVIWGSDLPLDVVDNIHGLKKINRSSLKVIVGSHDEYVSTDKVDKIIVEMHEKGVDFDFHTFEGKHALHKDSIRYFHARLVDDKLEY